MGTILLTGYEPFGHTPINPAEQVARRLDGAEAGGAKVASRVVPNVFFECIDIVAAAIAELEPHTVVMMGEYGGRAMVTIERIAEPPPYRRQPRLAGQETQVRDTLRCALDLPGSGSGVRNAPTPKAGAPIGGLLWDSEPTSHEVTAGDTEFLNAVAATDTYGVYHTWMDYDADPSREGCNSKRQGAPGSYTYSVASDWANRPVNYVSWADATRFANWMHNGQPTGAQDLTTTEDVSYFLNGTSENADGLLENVVREPDATWVIPAEDEWYKAAYHKNDGVTGNYWNYPTSADSGVSNQLVDPDPRNNATFGNTTIGAPYYRTKAGAHENSASPYGTFDQGDNVMGFTEAVPEPDIRRIRGGSWQMAGSNTASREFDDVMHSSDQFNDLGFRVVTLAEPSQPVPVPALSDRGLLAMLLSVAFVGTSVLRTRARAQARIERAEKAPTPSRPSASPTTPGIPSTGTEGDAPSGPSTWIPITAPSPPMEKPYSPPPRSAGIRSSKRQ